MADMTVPGPFIVRSFNDGDLPAALALSQRLGWSHTLEDWTFFHEIATGFVAERDRVVIGTALCFLYGDHHASIGMVITHPDHQRQGIGLSVMRECLALLQGRTVHLISTEVGMPMYTRLGFEATGELSVFIRRQPIAGPAVDGVRMARDGDLDVVRDHLVRGQLPRQLLIKRLTLNLKEEVAVVEGHDQGIVGVAICREFGSRRLIGPLVANNEETARALIAFFLNLHPTRPIRIDRIGTAPPAEWLTERGFTREDGGTPMVRDQRDHMILPDQSSGTTGMTEFAVASQATC